VDHVDCQHRIHSLQGPGQPGDIEVDRDFDVGARFFPEPQGHRRAKLRVLIGRLPGEVRERIGEMHDVLSVPLAISSHQAAPGQDARKHLEDRALVAFRRRAGPLPVRRHVTVLLEHRVAP
jgi:hypothetical protein